MKKWGAMYLAFRREDMEDKIIKREDDRMGKMKQLPATASAAHDWAHLTHAAADPKN